MIILLFGIGIIATMVFVAPTLARRRVLGKREKLCDGELLEQYVSSSHLSGETILKILKVIGAGYGIEYSKLRPSDCFVTKLSKIDSWHLDAGAEKLEKYLFKEFGITIPKDLRTFTILDLLQLIDNELHRPTG